MKAILFLSILTFLSCKGNQSFDLEKATQEILELHHQQSVFHFQKMAPEFANLLSENHISVNRGAVQSPTIEENTKKFQSYFDQVEFVKWDDIKPPVVRFSDDGSLAYTTVEKEVVNKYKNEEGQEILESTIFAWVAIYKKNGNEWKIDCVASTNAPSEEQIIE